MDSEATSAVFDDIKAVLAHLKLEGWKISKASLYLHISDGKLRPRKDGKYEIRDVDKYAKTFLKLLGAPGKTSEMLNKLQQKRIAAETKKAVAQAEHWETKTRVFSGAYVPRSMFESELSKRAITLRNDFENFCRYEAAGIVNQVDGNPEKIPDLTEFMLGKVNVFLNRYAANREFTTSVVVLPPEDPDSREDEGDEENED